MYRMNEGNCGIDLFLEIFISQVKVHFLECGTVQETFTVLEFSIKTEY